MGERINVDEGLLEKIELLKKVFRIAKLTFIKQPIAKDKSDMPGILKILRNSKNISDEQYASCEKELTEFEQLIEQLYEGKKLSLKEVENAFNKHIIGKYTIQYDKSDFNRELLATEPITGSRKIRWKPIIGAPENTYRDEQTCTEIKIQVLGELLFQHWNGLDDSITQYKIRKENSLGRKSEYKIFSNVKIDRVNKNVDDDYSVAVICGLLSDENLQLSNAKGYVGAVKKIKEKEDGTNKGEHVVNQSYYIACDETASTAVQEYINEREKQEER